MQSCQSLSGSVFSFLPSPSHVPLFPLLPVVLEQHAVEAIWQAVGDLTASHEPQEVRHAVLKFLSALIRGQYQTLGVLRGYFFEVVRSHQVPEDLMERCFGTCVHVHVHVSAECVCVSVNAVFPSLPPSSLLPPSLPQVGAAAGPH